MSILERKKLNVTNVIKGFSQIMMSVLIRDQFMKEEEITNALYVKKILHKILLYCFIYETNIPNRMMCLIKIENFNFAFRSFRRT